MDGFQDLYLWNLIKNKWEWFCMSMWSDKDAIIQRKQQVEELLESQKWIEIIDNWYNYGVDVSKVVPENQAKVFSLLTENSVLLEALCYQSNDRGVEFKDIKDLENHCAGLLDSIDSYNFHHIYSYAAIDLRTILSNLDSSIMHGYIVFSEAELASLKSIRSLQKTLLSATNGRNVLM